MHHAQRNRRPHDMGAVAQLLNQKNIPGMSSELLTAIVDSEDKEGEGFVAVPKGKSCRPACGPSPAGTTTQNSYEVFVELDIFAP